MNRRAEIKKLCELRQLRDRILTESDHDQARILLLRLPNVKSIATWNTANRLELNLLNGKMFTYPASGGLKQCAITAYLEYIKAL